MGLRKYSLSSKRKYLRIISIKDTGAFHHSHHVFAWPMAKWSNKTCLSKQNLLCMECWRGKYYFWLSTIIYCQLKTERSWTDLHWVVSATYRELFYLHFSISCKFRPVENNNSHHARASIKIGVSERRKVNRVRWSR